MKKFFGISAILATALTAATVFGVMILAQNNFYNEAAQNNMAEIELGNLALQKAQSEDVKEFARKMVEDHTATGERLRQLAASKNVTLPTDTANKHKRAAEKLNNLSGEEFDREFMKQMVKDHEAAVKLFQRQADRGEDAEVKAFAAETLPTLRSHLEMARSMSDGMKNTNRGGNNRNSDSNMNTNGNSNRSMNMNSNSDQNMNSNGNSNSNMNMNSNSNRNTNTNVNTNTNRNTNSNTNSNMNSNTNTNRNSNSNTNRNSNTNTNTNSNSNTRNSNGNSNSNMNGNFNFR